MNHPHRHNNSPGHSPYRFEHGSSPWMRLPVGSVGPPAFRPMYGIPMVPHTMPSNMPHMRPTLQTPPTAQPMVSHTMINSSGRLASPGVQQIQIANTNSPGEPLSLTTKKSLPSSSPSDEYQALDLRVPTKKPRVDDPDQPLDLSKGPRLSPQPQRKMVATVKPKMAATMFPSPGYAPHTRDVTIVKTETKPEIESPVASTSTNLSSTASLIGDHPVDDILYLHCKNCQSSYGSVHGFRKHFRTTHGYQPTSDDVLIQGIKATREYVAQQSAAAATCPDLKPRYHCELCGWQYDARANMVIEQHRSTHKDTIVVCCVYCKDTFSHKGQLFEHLSQKHPENYQFICSICKMAFPVDQQLSFHMQSTHGMLVSRTPPQYGLGQRFGILAADRSVASPSSQPHTSPVMKLECPRSHTSCSPSMSASSQILKAEPRSADTSTSAPNWMRLLDKVVEQELGAGSRDHDDKTDNIPSLPATQPSKSEPKNLAKPVYPHRTSSRTSPASQSAVTSTDYSAPTSHSFSMMHQHLERAITRELLSDDNNEQSLLATIKPADSSKSPSHEQSVDTTAKEKSQSPQVTSSKPEQDHSQSEQDHSQTTKTVQSENKTIEVTEIDDDDDDDDDVDDDDDDVDDDDDEPRNLTIVEEPIAQTEEQERTIPTNKNQRDRFK